MNELKIFQNSEFGELGVLVIDGKEFFPATDCAKALGYTNPRKAIIDHCKGVTKRDALTDGGIQTINFIPEGDLYRLIVRSQLPAAERFERWVFDEVLPAIRRHGMYATPDTVEAMLADPDTMIRTLTALKEERAARVALEAKAEADAPKVLFADSVAASKQSILVGELATLLRQNGIQIGQNRLFEELRRDGYLVRQSGERWNLPTQRAMELGLFEIKERTVNAPDGSVRLTRTTKVTGKGQIYFINRYRKEAEQWHERHRSSGDCRRS